MISTRIQQVETNPHDWLGPEKVPVAAQHLIASGSVRMSRILPTCDMPLPPILDTRTTHSVRTP